MLYPICPTCGTCLADIEPVFEVRKDKICENPELSEEDKNLAIQKLVNEMNLRRLCCKMRLITYVDLIKIVK